MTGKALRMVERAPSAANFVSERRAAAPIEVPFAADDFDRDVWCVLGVPVDIATLPSAVQAIEIAVRDRRRLSFITPNVNFLVRASRSEEDRRRMVDADLSLVDGAPLVAIAKLLGAPIKERCAGSDVFEMLRRRPGFAGRRLRVFFFGGREGAAEAAAAALNAERGGLEAVGSLNPGYGDIATMSAPDLLERINGAEPDFLVVAMGAAKGQAWIDRNLSSLSVPVVSHLGAVVDFTGGKIARAPKIVQRIGLEWAWRIKADPSLWRRYLSDAVAFGVIALTRLAPALMSSRSRRTGVPATVSTVQTANGPVVRLAGDLTSEHLTPIRQAFRSAAQSNDRVIVDFADAGSIDGAFLGLLLMLDKGCRARGAALALAGLDRSRRRAFRAHGVSLPEHDLEIVADGSAAIEAVA